MFHRPIAAEHRFFFALLPPIRLARQLANAADWLGKAGRPVAADRLHITLLIPPDQFARAPELIDRLRAVGENVATAPVDIMLDYVSGGSRSVALRPQHRIASLAALRQEIARLCASHGIAERPDYTFHPHVTLGYRDGRPFGERVPPVAWTAPEFVLIHSHLGRTKHSLLGRWPLTGPAETQLALF